LIHILRHGTNQPTGVVSTTGVTDCSRQRRRCDPAEVIELETTVATASADVGRLPTSPPPWGGVLKQMVTATYGDKMVWGRRDAIERLRLDRLDPSQPRGVAELVLRVPRRLSQIGRSGLDVLRSVHRQHRDVRVAFADVDVAVAPAQWSVLQRISPTSRAWAMSIPPSGRARARGRYRRAAAGSPDSDGD
jgi:hypothetical protein